jgi:hypothetical protein
MKKVFIESTQFTKTVDRFLDDEAYSALQRAVMQRPDAGKVMSGCGGLRKLRIPDPGRRKGKRGGARIIYLHVPAVDWIFLLDVYDKDEKDDLSKAEKKILRDLAEQFKKQALASAQKRRGDL